MTLDGMSEIHNLASSILKLIIGKLEDNFRDNIYSICIDLVIIL